MFNHDSYQERLEQLKEQVRADIAGCDPDLRRTWEYGVSLRYARFLAWRTLDQLQRVTDTFAGYNHVADKQKHREYCAAELMGVVAGIHAASALMRGAVLTADPIGAQAMMMIYDEANELPKMEASAEAAGS